MTPRSLVTVIGATAIAFAVVIGAAVGTPSGAPILQNEAAVAVDSLEDEARQGAPERLAAWNDSCVIAL
jgi:hypothetical protein